MQILTTISDLSTRHPLIFIAVSNDCHACVVLIQEQRYTQSKFHFKLQEFRIETFAKQYLDRLARIQIASPNTTPLMLCTLQFQTFRDRLLSFLISLQCLDMLAQIGFPPGSRRSLTGRHVSNPESVSKFA